MSPRIEMAALTHPGRVRPHNEDCIAAHARSRLAVLADGMGGHNAGEVASRIVVDLVISGPLASSNDSAAPPAETEALIAGEIARANAALLDAARADPRCDGMGTTLVVVLWSDAVITYGHVGDSRLYRLRAGALQRLTRDHSLVQDQIDRGELTARAARNAPHRNVLTRALGTGGDVTADVRSEPVVVDDLYLLCSDGLTDMLSDEDIRETLLGCGASIGLAAQRLVDRANDGGGVDNISVILAHVAAVNASSR